MPSWEGRDPQQHRGTSCLGQVANRDDVFGTIGTGHQNSLAYHSLSCVCGACDALVRAHGLFTKR